MPAFPSAPSLAINMNVAPGGFRDWLKQANSRLSAQSITHRLHVPDELRFWIFLEFGTAPHEIKAKYAKALHFGIGDKELFRDHVNHPGMRPKLVYRAIRDEWQQYLSTLHITEELLNLSTGGFGLDVDELIAGAVKVAAELMAERLEQIAPGHHEDGKLKGQTAAEAWLDSYEIL